MHVNDCVDGLLLATEKARDKVNILNLGVDGYCTVRDSIGWICEYLNVSPKLEFGSGDRGWIGDNPFIHLDVSRMKALGWSPKTSIQAGIVDTLRWIRENQWIYEKRK